MSRTPIWHVPYQRNPFFAGREDVLAQLHQTLQADTTVALSHPQGISGLGGIGKSQTALEYAYRYRTDYKAVFWVRADSITSLTSSYVELALVLMLPERYEQDQETIVQAVLRWLRNNTGWLLIYDNIEDLGVAEPFLPKAGQGHIIFTTRSHALSSIARLLDLGTMGPETGALLLLRRASILPLQAPLDLATMVDRSIASLIVQELDGLPLALDQAGAYIKETLCSLQDYLTLYQKHRFDLLQARGSLEKDYPASVATTWSLSFEKVGQASPAAAELLNFCAFLAPDAIPEDIITQGASYLSPVLALEVNDLLHLDQILKELMRYSLLQRAADTCTFSIHRLVQAVLQDSLSSEAHADWKQRAVLAVNAASPNVQDVGQWAMCELWLPHALVCVTWIEQEQFYSKESASLLNQAGYYLDDHARYAEAEPLYRFSLAISEEQLGVTHPDTATSLNNLADLYNTQGKYEEAEPLYQRALSIREKVLGSNHPSVAISLNNLAMHYYNQGKYNQAEPLLQRALSITERILGPHHPGVATNLNNLALLYKSQNKYEHSISLYRRALSIREQTLPPGHPDLAQSLNNLADLSTDQGKYEEAESLYQQSLSIFEKMLGPSHPNVAINLNNLAELYRIQGKHEEAESLFQRSLSIFEQALGPSHPNTVQSLNNLAMLYCNQGRYEEAEFLSQRAFSVFEQTLGPDHPNTVQSLKNLAALYRIQSKHTEAESLYLRGISFFEQALGPHHSSVAQCLNDLALLYKSQGKFEEADSLYWRALFIRQRALGPNHHEVAQSLNNLATLYYNQGRYEEAESLFHRAISTFKQSVGPDHPNAAQCFNNLATLYYNQGRYEEAESLFQQAIAIFEQTPGPQHSKLARVLTNYAILLRKMKRNTEAPKLLTQATKAGTHTGELLTEVGDIAHRERVSGPTYKIDEQSSVVKTIQEVPGKIYGFPEVWNVSRRHIPFFTGRDHVLQEISDRFKLEYDAGIVSPLAITGQGGIGKTQTATEYAYRFRGDYQTVLWVRAETQEGLMADFKTIAHLLNFSPKHLQNRATLMQTLREWFMNRTAWLLIFDGADNLDLVEPFLPPICRGHILLTTRAGAVSHLAQPLILKPLGPEDGALCILRRSGLLSSNKHLSDASAIQIETATKLSQLVDGLPLALEQAGAFIEETACGVQRYLEHYKNQQHKHQIQQIYAGPVPDYPVAVAYAWTASRNMVQHTNPAATEILQLCAFLAPEAIPEEIFIKGAVALGPVLQAATADIFAFNKLISILRKYSLINRDVDRETDTTRLSISRILQDVLHSEMDEETQHLWAERAVRSVYQTLPFVEWPVMLPHVRICLQHIKSWNMTFKEAEQLRHQAESRLSAYK